MTDTIYDVLIVGGGPAGCATALSLARYPELRTRLVEGSSYDRARIGESIPPETRDLFEALKIRDAFEAEKHERCLGSCSSWGVETLGYNDHLLNPRGLGWHLERNRFDQFLSAQAKSRGVEVSQGWRYRGHLRFAREGHWLVDGQTQSRSAETIRARFVVDATGRAARVANVLGARARVADQFVCVSAFLDGQAASSLERMTLLEAVRDGWWYAARVAPEKVVLAFATQASVVRKYGLRNAPHFVRALQRSKHTKDRVSLHANSIQSIHSSAIMSALMSPPAGNGWAAVGDAASSFDPISSQGIYKALQDGLQVGDAIVRWLDRDLSGLEAYRKQVLQRYVEYLRQRDYFYQLEKRWPQSEFWRARWRASQASGLRTTESPSRPASM